MRRYLTSACLALLAELALPLPGHGQNQGLVVRDGTLGSAPAGIVGAGLDPASGFADYLISDDLGERPENGTNLFHSFERFSIGTGEVATFTGPEGIDNVIGRVTGRGAEYISRIDGTLRSTVEGAALWLMNPNGMVFGNGAHLEVPRAFYATTANFLAFEEGVRFLSAPDADLDSRLATAPPRAFGFLDDEAAQIDFRGTSSAPLGIVGEEIEYSCRDCVDTKLLAVTQELPVDARSPGIVGLRSSSLSELPSASLGNVTLKSGSVFGDLSVAGKRVTVDSARVIGELFVHGRQVTLSGFIMMTNGIHVVADELNLLDATHVLDTSGLSGVLFEAPRVTISKANLDGGQIRIRSSHLVLTDTVLGDLATGLISLTGDSNPQGATRIIIRGSSLRLTDLPLLSRTEILGLTINGDEVEVQGSSFRASSRADFDDPVDAGRIQIRGERMLVIAGSTFESEALGNRLSGNSGSIEFEGEQIRIRDSVLSAEATEANGGNVTIQAEDLVHITNSEITTSVDRGRGGNVRIDPILVLLEDSNIKATASEQGGVGGAIDIETLLFFAFENGDLVPRSDLSGPGRILDAFAPGGPRFSGTVEVNAPDTDIAGTLTALPTAFTDPASRIQPTCGARGAAAGSFRQGSGRRLPRSPDGNLVAYSEEAALL